MEWVLGLLSGLLSGNAVGAKNGLGVAGNSLAGAIGGGLTGALFQGLMTGGGMDVTQIVGQVGVGGLVGAVLTVVVGAIVKRSKSQA